METINNKLKIAVLMGGESTERDVSIESGDCVAAALQEAGFQAAAVDIRADNLDILEDNSIDVFFIALHGGFGEGGQLQQILEDRGLVYTGSGPEASRLALDKLASKDLFARAGVTTPKAIEFGSVAEAEEFEKQLSRLGEKFVVKPVRQGSAVGITVADGPKSAITAAQKCMDEFGDCLIEEYIPGREITAGILENQALPIIEIRPKENFYNYHAKYVDEQTEYLFDTVEPARAAKIQTDALACFGALGLMHFARIDFILGDDGKAYALEVNAIPGMTAHSLLPKAAAKAGISMSDLCAKIVEAAYSLRVTCDS